MRLRQIALVSGQLDQVVNELGQVFGLKVAYVDPNVGTYGLRNAVLACGTGFLEVVEPITREASAARFLAKRGGDAGYMVIIQTPDAVAERDRVAALGVRVVDVIDRPHYFAAHFHPSDFGGILASLDQQRTASDYLEPYGDWMPAGPGWREARTDQVIELLSVSISAPDPAKLAALWSQLLAHPLSNPTAPASTPASAHRSAPATSGSASSAASVSTAVAARQLLLEHGAVCFEASAGATSAVVSAVTLKVRDVAGVRARAKQAGLAVQADAVRIGGVDFRFVG